MDVRPLSEGLRKKAEKELNENPERLRNDLQHLREWLSKQPHLYVRTDDQWLLAFLRSCKFNLEKVKDKLDYFYSVRQFLPEYFTRRDPFLREIQAILKAGCVLPLSKTRKVLGPRIIFFYCTAFDHYTMTFENIFKVFTMISDVLMLEDDDSVVSGICLLIDHKALNPKYFSQFTPLFIKRCVAIGQDMYPLRNKGFYFVNSPSYLQSALQIIKFFLNDKSREKMFVYSRDNSDKIYDHIPKEALPCELGGSCGSVREIANYWKEKIESYRKWFIEDENYCSDEAKRIGTSKTASNIFGVGGSLHS